jgi:phosphatidylserine/phosphatidylglycerophosphate/cardiolipin synthase-like enzyme
LWETANPSDPLPDLQNLNDPPPTHLPPPPPPPSIIDRPEDGVCDVQIVRTLSTDQFKNMDEGEKGILEAYQRGIANATDFIYLETQYFTNDKIAEALYKRLALQPTLQVIVLLNIAPDTPIYPFKQRRLITRIRREMRRNNKKVEPSSRFGVFTRWRHETGTPRPQLLPVYIHAKAAVIDNNWATVGSANLDGLSLDSSLPSDIVRGIATDFGIHSTREQRAIEVNGLMLDSATSTVADVLRRKLWAEHLGYVDTHGALDINAADLRRENRPPGPAAQDPNQPPKTPQGGWLKLWHDRAAATLQSLTNNPSQPTTGTAGMGAVLPWPEDDTTHSSPRDYLTTLGVHSYAVVPLKGTRKFDFKAGAYPQGSKAPMDYD